MNMQTHTHKHTEKYSKKLDRIQKRAKEITREREAKPSEMGLPIPEMRRVKRA